MYATTRKQVKGRARPAPVRNTVVLFDGGRRARVPDFGAGLSTTRYSGQHGFMPFTAEDDAWARELSAATVAELDAAEDRYDEILEQRYLESAFLDRYTRGHLAI
jgi:hypothetical protein